MDKERDKARIRLFLRFFAPFGMIILLVSFAAGFWIYRQSAGRVRDEIDAQFHNSLEKAVSFLDTQFSEMDRIAYNLTEKADLKPFSIYLNKYIRSRASNEISSYVSANSYIDDVILYYGGTVSSHYQDDDLFLSSLGAFEAKTAWEYLYSFKEFAYADFQVLVRGLSEPCVLSALTNDSMYPIAKTHMLYVVPNGTDSAVLFLLNLQKTEAFFASELAYYEGSLRVWKKDGQPLFSLSYAQGGDAEYDAADFPPANVPVARPLSGNGLRIAYQYPQRGWTFVLDWYKPPYVTLLRDTFLVQIPYMLLILIGGISIAVWVSRRAFAPIAKVYDSVASRAKPLVVSFEGMVESLQEIENRWDELNFQMQRQRELCHLQVIGGILKGRYQSDTQIRALLRDNEIDLEGDMYLPLAVRVSNLSQGNEGDMERAFPRYLRALCLAPGEKRFTVTLDQVDTYACVCVLPANTDVARHARVIFSALSQGLPQGASVTAGVGEPTDSLTGIAAAYTEAATALRFEFLLGRNRLISISEVRENRAGEIVWYPVQTEEILLRAVAAGDAQVAGEQIMALARMLLEMRSSLNVARSILSGILRRLADTFRARSNAHGEAEMIRIEHMLSRNANTMDEIAEEMRQAIEEACESRAEPDAGETDGFSARVNEYLRASLSNELLALPDIAEAFHVSPGHLSRVYKQESGYTVIQALDLMRMDVAEEALRNTDMALGDILRACGYTDKGNFIRKFKKHFSVTPIRYREIMREHKPRI